MLKGIQKKIIVIKTQKDSCFESAFFILRSENSQGASENEIIYEAQRIISEGERQKKRKGIKESAHPIASVILSLICGIALGSASVWILWLIIG